MQSGKGRAQCLRILQTFLKLPSDDGVGVQLGHYTSTNILLHFTSEFLTCSCLSLPSPWLGNHYSLRTLLLVWRPILQCNTKEGNADTLNSVLNIMQCLQRVIWDIHVIECSMQSCSPCSDKEKWLTGPITCSMMMVFPNTVKAGVVSGKSKSEW